MAQIEFHNLTFAYEGSSGNVFEHLNLRLDSRWRLGVVGRNGRGKSTLLGLLSGRLDSGGAISGAPDCTCFPPPVDHPQWETLAVLEELEPQLPLWKIRRELSMLEVDEEVLYRPFETLSGGERVKVLLAALFSGESRFPLIDEPTDHLDLEGRAVVSRYLKRQAGFVLVSHDRTFLDGCVDHILALERQDVQVRQGDFSAWWRDREARDAWEAAEQERLKREITRLEGAARRTAAWSDKTEQGKHVKNSGLRPDRGYVGHKAAKLMKRAKSAQSRREAAVEQTSALLKNLEREQPLKLHPLEHPKRRLVEAEDLTPDYGGGAVCAPVSFTLEQGERLALVGRNGAGKSTLLKLVCGEDIPHGGVLRLASGLNVSYVPQDASGLEGDLSAFAAASGIDETLFKTILRKLDFSRPQLEKDMGSYSAGQKKKVLLARSLCQSAHLYVWDEPLNYVDVFSRMQLEALLRDYPCTLLLVEHDASFLQAVGARTVEVGR